MAGEIWRSAFQMGVEVTPGTPVAATRKMYFQTDGSQLGGPGRDVRLRRFAVGRRSNAIAASRGPLQPGGQVVQFVDPSENLELYLIGLQGGVTPSSGVWTFTPGNNVPDAATLEWKDGDNEWRIAGVHANSLRWSGDVNGDNTLTAELFGRTFASNALTGSLTDRTPTWKEGYETRLFVDALGGTPGTTAYTDNLIAWDVTFTNNLQRKYFANNTQNVGGIAIGEMDVQAQLTLEAASTNTDTETTASGAGTTRLVQLKFGADAASIRLNIPGIWGAEDRGQTDRGTRVYRMTLLGLYDATNAYQFQVKAESARLTAW